MKRFIPSLLAMACAATVQAAEPVSEDVFFGEMPMVLTASRIAQSPLDAPAPVTVIDRETIRASGFTEIHDLLRLVPGFHVASWGFDAPVVAHHGMASSFPRNLLVMMDGRSLVNPITGSVEWLDIPVRVEDVERIEVVRGPNQASYGAMALSGVVNIITRLPGEDEGGALVLSRGERDFRDAYARFAARGENFDWRVSVSDRSANTLEDRAQNYSNYQVTNGRKSLRADGIYRLGLNDSLNFDIGLVDGTDEKGSARPDLSDEEPRRGSDRTTRYLNLGWKRGYGSDSEFSLRYFHFDLDKRESYIDSRFAPLLVSANLDYEIKRDDLEMQWSHRFSDTTRGLFGAGIRRDAVESQRYFYNLGTVDGTQWQIFGNLDWRLAPDWLLNFGGMIEKYDDTDAKFSPRLALNYYLAPEQSLRVSAGRGYRAPTLLESNAYEIFTTASDLAVPSPPFQVDLIPAGSPFYLAHYSPYDIEPERSDFIELGYVGRFDALKLLVDARVYAENYSNLILSPGCWVGGMPADDDGKPACSVTPFPPGYLPLIENLDGPYNAFPYGNTGTVQVRGAELSLDWRHDRLGRFLAAYAITDISADANAFDADDDIPRSAPKHSASLLWSKPFPKGISASVGLYYVGEMMWMVDGDEQPAHTRVDARLAKRFGNASQHEIALTARNLNGKYPEFRSSAEWSYTERQAFVTLRLGW